MTLRVRTLRRANADILSITDYIYQRSPQGAATWVNAFEKAKRRLADNAVGCSEADENHRFEIELKQSLFKTRRGRVYRLVFTIVDDEVRILRVRGSGQGPIEPGDI
jgi:plasmid stabilization system protein ParE